MKELSDRHSEYASNPSVEEYFSFTRPFLSREFTSLSPHDCTSYEYTHNQNNLQGVKIKVVLKKIGNYSSYISISQ